MWAADGSELFYRVDDRVMAVAVHADGTVGTPTELYEGEYTADSAAFGTRQYHVAPDVRFLMLKRTDTTTVPEVQPQVVLVENWHLELPDRVPVD